MGVKLTIREIENKKEIGDIISIRKEVFVKEQNVPEGMEIDGEDDKAIHIIAILGKKPIGCARIRIINNKAKLERISVLKEYRGNGYGKDLVEFLIKFCLEKKVKEIYMHAQYYLKDFYSDLEFVERGSAFDEAGIKHIEMVYK